MDFLTNPWVITLIVVSVIIGNIALLKYTANMKFGDSERKALDRLNELDKKRHGNPDNKD
ncbi:DUF2897 family protein [Vibrio sp.]|uniref:DUF2897 family protein n=1 Tax=Vibrio sp. TaxID=678 RepID=UPI003D14D472